TPTRSRLGNLPCNPAPRIYKGGRGTPSGTKTYIAHKGTHPQSPDHTTITSSNPRAYPSTGITQPQTGRRVLPPPEGPNLSKLCVPFERLVLPSHLRFDNPPYKSYCR